MGLRYDLHIHSALSPCAEDEMTPAAIAGLCRLAGAEVIAIADHNSALNLPAARAACDFYGLRLLPAIEVNTSEEIHLLCYLPTVEAALSLGEAIYETLPDIAADPEIWGRQLIMNEEDEVIGEVGRLLTNACGLDIYSAKALCESLGGLAVPAHVDKDAFSLLSVLGFMPDDLNFPALEFRAPARYADLAAKGLLPVGCEVLTSSDAHCLTSLKQEFPLLGQDSVLCRLLDRG